MPESQLTAPSESEPRPNPLLSEEAADASIFPGFDFKFEEGTGNALLLPDEGPSDESAPDPAVRLVEESNDPGKDLQARLRGLQAKVTPTFQENAQLKRELAELKSRLDLQDRRESLQTSDRTIADTIEAAVREAVGEEGYVEPAALAKALNAALPKTLDTYVKQTIAPQLEAVQKLQQKVESAERLTAIQVKYGQKLPLMAQAVQVYLEKDPTLLDNYTPEQLFEQAHADLVQLAQEMAAQQPTGEEAPDPAAEQRAIERARQNATDPGVSPGPGAPGLPASRPKTLDDAIAAAFVQSGFGGR